MKGTADNLSAEVLEEDEAQKGDKINHLCGYIYRASQEMGLTPEENTFLSEKLTALGSAHDILNVYKAHGGDVEKFLRDILDETFTFTS